jgi:hypothetical protein
MIGNFQTWECAGTWHWSNSRNIFTCVNSNYTGSGKCVSRVDTGDSRMCVNGPHKDYMQCVGQLNVVDIMSETFD